MDRKILNQMIAENDQDEAACLEWVRTAPLEELMAMWGIIQKPYKDRGLELMSRFAQLAFGRAVEKVFCREE